MGGRIAFHLIPGFFSNFDGGTMALEAIPGGNNLEGVVKVFVSPVSVWMVEHEGESGGSIDGKYDSYQVEILLKYGAWRGSTLSCSLSC